jgi:uncharacterized protein YoxC
MNVHTRQNTGSSFYSILFLFFKIKLKRFLLRWIDTIVVIMVTITKNRLRTSYERAARALEEAQAAYDAIATEHAALFQHLDEIVDWYNDVESRLATDATQEEFDEVTEAWENASDAIDAISGDAWNILCDAKDRAHHAYADYIA